MCFQILLIDYWNFVGFLYEMFSYKLEYKQTTIVYLYAQVKTRTMFTYRLKHEQDQCLQIGTSINMADIYPWTQVKTRIMVTYRLKYEHEQYLPIESSIKTTNLCTQA